MILFLNGNDEKLSHTPEIKIPYSPLLAIAWKTKHSQFPKGPN
jgi:hypothetical protein